MYRIHCDTARQQLSALHDGELSPLRTWLLHRHLRTCADCRQQVAALQQLDTLLFAADVVGVSQELQAVGGGLPHSVLAASVLDNRAGRGKSKRRIVSRLAGGLAAAGVVAFGLLFVPHNPHKRNSLSASAQVRRALANINTWHLKGWKMQNGQRVPWEVWGQRQPFFYREQIGPDIIVDNGVQRVSLYAPYTTRYKGTRPGIALIMPSNSAVENVRWSYRRMVDHWKPDMSVWRHTPEGPIFNENFGGYANEGDQKESMTDFIYAINRRTWLPRWFEQRRGKITDGEREPSAHLDIVYDVPLSESVRALPTPPTDYVTYDSTSRPPAVDTESTVTKGGITIQLKPLASDDEGNVLIEARAWIGDTPVGKNDPLRIGLSQADDASEPLNTGIPRLSYDDQKRAYVEVNWYSLRYGNPDDATSLMIWTPMEPAPSGTPSPAQLKVNLLVALAIDSRMGGTLYPHQDRILLQQKMEVPVTLPSPGEPLAQRIGDYLKAREFQSIAVNGLDTLEAAIPCTRMSSYRNMSTSREIKERYFFWAERYVAIADSQFVQMWREDLANDYLLAGNRKRAVELFYDILNEPRFRDVPPAMQTMSPFWTSRKIWEEQLKITTKNIKRWSAEKRERARSALQRLGEPVK
jgi:hypothetical protein